MAWFLTLSAAIYTGERITRTMTRLAIAIHGTGEVSQGNDLPFASFRHISHSPLDANKSLVHIQTERG